MQANTEYAGSHSSSPRIPKKGKTRHPRSEETGKPREQEVLGNASCEPHEGEELTSTVGGRFCRWLVNVDVSHGAGRVQSGVQTAAEQMAECRYAAGSAKLPLQVAGITLWYSHLAAGRLWR